MERYQECEEEDTRDRSEVGDQDGDDADRGPHISPLLSSLLAATPHAAEGLGDQTGPRILEDPERIAARILEDVTGSRRNLDGSTLRLPTAGPQVLRRRFQILHFEQGQARGSGTVVREQVLRPFRESESGNVRPELVVIPKDGRTEDLGVVFQIAFEIRGSDVEVSEPTEWRSHGRRNAFLGIITLGRATKHEIEQQGMGDAFAGKPLVDVTNAFGREETVTKKSGAEELQEMARTAQVVKAFNTAFAHTMSTGQVLGDRITAFVAGDDKRAKERILRM